MYGRWCINKNGSVNIEYKGILNKYKIYYKPSMPKKRRNQGRNKNNRGHVKCIVCSNCGRRCPKDKAVKRFNIKDIVDASSKKDLEEQRAFDPYVVPKLYIKMQYCISCAIHSRIVKVRSTTERRVRTPPQRIQRDAAGRVVPKKEDQKWLYFESLCLFYRIPYLEFHFYKYHALVSQSRLCEFSLFLGHVVGQKYAETLQKSQRISHIQ